MIQSWLAEANVEDLRKRLHEARTPLQVVDLRRELENLADPELFRALFPIAVNMDEKFLLSDGIAAEMLVELEPICPVSCSDALRMIEDGCWQVSDKRVPFYLVTQFGKRFLCNTIAQLEREGCQHVGGIGYWVTMPSWRMIEGFEVRQRGRLWADAERFHKLPPGSLKDPGPSG